MSNYAYFQNDSPVVMHFGSLLELQDVYMSICNPDYVKTGNAHKEFNKHMNADGYIILEGDNMLFFIDVEKSNEIISDLIKNARINIVEIMKNKLNI